MTETLKDRPAQLVRRAPRPAPDEKVDPVDYSPTAVLPVPAPVAAPAQSGGGVVEPDAGEEVTEKATAPEQPKPEQKTTEAAAASAPAKEKSRPSKAAKSAPNKKSTRREVTFPLSTRISQEVMDILYAAVDEEGITVREAIEMGIKHRWG